tara:strand:- start:14752 stop:16674 length:1923 start_codon:yes stop_codon:yes gene_type:complete
MASDTSQNLEILGLLPSIKAGEMNAVTVNKEPNLTYSSTDSVLTVSQKLNSVIPLQTYGTLKAIVAFFDQNNIGEMNTKLFPQGSPATLPSVAYVFIDVIHADIASFVNNTNYKFMLTAVEVIDQTVLVPGDQIMVSFMTTDYSRAAFVKKLEANPASAALALLQQIQKACNSFQPKVELKKPIPRSTPNNFTNRNSGYFQALYELARWQSDNYNVKISNVQFPFDEETAKGLRSGNINIQELFAKGTAANEKVISDLQGNNNPQKQWAMLVREFFFSATYVPNPNGKMIVTLDGATDLDSKIKDLNNFSKTYTAKKNNDTSFLFSFPKGINFGTNALLDQTKKNLTKFLNSFEKIKNQPVQPPPAPPKPAAQVSNNISAACGNFTPGGTSYIQGVPFVERGFARKTPLRNPSVIVVHHSVSYTANSTAKTLLGKNASIHFNVGRANNKGVIEQWLPVDIKGAHAGRLNSRSIGVENTSFRGGFFDPRNYTPGLAHSAEELEPLYQFLLKLTKKIGIPFSIAEANVTAGYFFVGKLEEPVKGGVRAHGSDLGTTHTDGRFELLYCQLRLIGHNPTSAIKNAKAMNKWAVKNSKKKFYILKTKWRADNKYLKPPNKAGDLRKGNYDTALMELPAAGKDFGK